MSNKELILPILKDGKYGFIDSDFNMAIKPKYNYVRSAASMILDTAMSMGF